MTRTENKYSFSFNKLSKSWRQGQKPPVVDFCNYSDDKDLCVVTALEEYILCSSEQRKESNQTQLLLGTIGPYKEVISSTISGQVKTVLKLAGVNGNIFKGHSTRATSTSKANVSGLSLYEILERGFWSSASTWQRFYIEDIISATVATFQNNIFMKHKKLTKQELLL